MDAIVDKVAFITGGAGGIGLEMVKNLLQNNAKGVAIIDLSDEAGAKAINEIEKNFKPNKAIFIQADITNTKELEAAFKKTIQVFGNLDIVVNNAGIVNEYDCRKMISVNLASAIETSFLAIENFFEFKSGEEAIIFNTSSLSAFCVSEFYPAYAASKAGLVHFSRSIGTDAYYQKYKVRVLTLCPFFANTSLNTSEQTPNNIRNIEKAKKPWPAVEEWLTAKQVADSFIDIIKKGKNGSVWICDFGNKVFEVDFNTNKLYTR